MQQHPPHDASSDAPTPTTPAGNENAEDLLVDLDAIRSLETQLASLTPEDVDPTHVLAALTSSDDDGVRYHAIEAAGRLGIGEASPSIVRCLLAGRDGREKENLDVVVAAAKAGGRLAEQGAWQSQGRGGSDSGDDLDGLLDAMADLASAPETTSARVRKVAVKACGIIFDAKKKGRGSSGGTGRRKRFARKKKKEKTSTSEERTALAMTDRLLDDDADVRLAAVRTLTMLGSQTLSVAVGRAVQLMVEHPGEGAVGRALVALGARRELERLLEEGHCDAVKKATCRALRALEQEEWDEEEEQEEKKREEEDDDIDDEDNELPEPSDRILRAKKRLRHRATTWSTSAGNGMSPELLQAMDPGDVRDTLVRVDYDGVSVDEWNTAGLGRKPQVIKGATVGWQAADWTEELLRTKWGQERFRVGSDEEDRDVRLSLADFLSYLHECNDDNPMYLFEHIGEGPLESLLGQYSIPKYFTPPYDLFSVLSAEEERPPHRWMLYGGTRSGSAIHKDPLCTSAWNTSLFGLKRWLLFPPHARKVHLMPALEEALWPARIAGPSAWFERMLSRVRSPEWRGPPPVEILQQAGETVYVPAGWWHVVLNLEPAVAVTQNIGALHDYQRIEEIMRRKRPEIYEEWLARVRRRWPQGHLTALHPGE